LKYCSLIQDIAPLAKLKNLETLELRYCEKVCDLRPLRGIRKLKKLCLCSTAVKDISCLQDLDSLSFLDIDSCHITSLSDMEGFRNLEELWLPGYADAELHWAATHLPRLRKLTVPFLLRGDSAKLENLSFEFYLQLEEDKLVVKIKIKDQDNKTKDQIKESRGNIRKKFREILFSIAQEQKIQLSEYGRVGVHMGVAKLIGDYRKVKSNNVIDMKATIGKLNTLINLMDTVAKKIKT